MFDLEKAIGDLNPLLAISNPDHPVDPTVAGDHVPIKVLHADDSHVIRSTLRRRLEENGVFAVQSVANGDEAWAHLTELKNRSEENGEPLCNSVDIILSDIEMPGMDGYHLCKKIKDDPVLKALPVVLFSSLITDKLVHKGEAVGADGQFSKPDLTLIEFMKETVESRRLSA